MNVEKPNLSVTHAELDALERRAMGEVYRVTEDGHELRTYTLFDHTEVLPLIHAIRRLLEDRRV